MVRPISIPIHMTDTFSSIPLAIGLFVSASLLVALCARKHASKSIEPNTSPKSPMPLPKQLIASVGNVAAVMSSVHAKRSVPESGAGKEETGVWQKAILMGDKCRPPEFSGAIYYDYEGNRVPQLPKSPKASPLRVFTFQVEKTSADLDV